LSHYFGVRLAKVTAPLDTIEGCFDGLGVSDMELEFVFDSI